LSLTPGSAHLEPLDPSPARTEESIDSEKKRLAEIEQTIKEFTEEDQRGKKIYIEVDEQPPDHEASDGSNSEFDVDDLHIPGEPEDSAEQAYSDDDFEIDEEIDQEEFTASPRDGEPFNLLDSAG
jgi:hypothetical protein